MAGLIATQRTVRSGDRLSPSGPINHEKRLIDGIVTDCQKRRRHSQVPCRLNKPPAGLRLQWEISGLVPASECRECVGRANPAGAGAFVHKKPLRNLVLADDVKSVYDVVKAEANGLLGEL